MMWEIMNQMLDKNKSYITNSCIINLNIANF